MRGLLGRSELRASPCGRATLKSVGADLGAWYYGFRNSIPKG